MGFNREKYQKVKINKTCCRNKGKNYMVMHKNLGNTCQPYSTTSQKFNQLG